MKLKFHPTTLLLLLLLNTMFLVAQDPIEITRIDGIGAGNTFLEISPETRDNILNETFNGHITYLPDHGPIHVEVTNPNASTNGGYELTLIDEDMSNDVLDEMVYWQLTQIQSGQTVTSEFTITEEPEQYAAEFGITIRMEQTLEPGQLGENNGAIDAQIIYEDANGPEWLSGIPDEGLPGDPTIYNYIKTAPGENFNALDPDSDYANLGDGTWVPYTLCDWNPQPDNQPYLSPSWRSSSSGPVHFSNTLEKLPNVDIVFTSNKDLWSKCIVVESASEFYNGFGFSYQPEDDAEQFDIRPGISRDKDGNEVTDPSDTGFSWFPGYAINLETGERVNIFFGENSIFSCEDNNDEYCGANLISPIEIFGGDMLWNPSNERILESGYIVDNTLLNIYDGGQHMIYVTDQAYDECEDLNELLRFNDPSSNIDKIRALRKVRWTSFSLLEPGQSLLPFEDGLIPNDVTIKLRVDNTFQVEEGTAEFNGYPSYEFEISGISSVTEQQGKELLSNVSISPNLYSLKGRNTTLKLKNLPSNCQITLYSLEGQLLNSFSSPITNGSSLTVMDISNYLPSSINKGMYFLSIEKDNISKKTLKFIIL